MKNKTGFGGINFLNMLDEEPEQTHVANTLPELDIDIPVARASDFMTHVVKASAHATSGDRRMWGELLRMAEDRVNHNKASYWYLSELSNLDNYYARTAGNIASFIKDYVNKATSDVDWKELVKFAEVVRDQHDYETACSKLGCTDNSLKSEKIKLALTDLIRDFSGLSFDADITPHESIREMKAAAISHHDILMVVQARKVRHEEVTANMAKSEDIGMATVVAKLYNIPDSTGWCRFYAEAFKQGERTEQEIYFSLRQALKDNPAIWNEAKVALSEAELVNRIEDHDTDNNVTLTADLMYGEEVLVPAGEMGRVVGKEDELTTVLFGDYGVVASLPADQFEKGAKAVVYAYDYKHLDNDVREVLEHGECPCCTSKGKSGYMTANKVVPNLVTCLECGSSFNNVIGKVASRTQNTPVNVRTINGWTAGKMEALGIKEQKHLGNILILRDNKWVTAWTAYSRSSERDLEALPVEELQALIDNWMSRMPDVTDKPTLSMIRNKIKEVQGIIDRKKAGAEEGSRLGARTIGPRWKNKIKELVKKFKSSGMTGAYAIAEAVINELPSGVFDIWEGAHSEVERLVDDAVREAGEERDWLR